jgi:hypothetical protein
MNATSLTRQGLRTLLLIILLLGTTACAATVTALKYRDLEVQSKMSETVFLDPISPDQKTVWVEVKNTSDQEVDLAALTNLIAAKGYRVVSDPSQAHYLLQANVLYVGKASQAAIDQAIGAGYGGPLGGILARGVAGAGIGQSPTAVGIGAAAGGPDWRHCRTCRRGTGEGGDVHRDYGRPALRAIRYSRHPAADQPSHPRHPDARVSECGGDPQLEAVPNTGGLHRHAGQLNV